MFLTRAVHQFIHHKSRLILSVRSGIALHPPCFQWCWMSGAEVCVCVSVCVFGSHGRFTHDALCLQQTHRFVGGGAWWEKVVDP